jgi:hypothetical protein
MHTAIQHNSPPEFAGAFAEAVVVGSILPEGTSAFSSTKQPRRCLLHHCRVPWQLRNACYSSGAFTAAYNIVKRCIHVQPS